MRNLRIAFRNLSRQKKRSFLLGGAIAFGVLIITLVNSFTAGFVENIQENLSHFLAGQIFIQGYEKTDSGRLVSVIRDDRALLEAVRQAGIDPGRVSRRSTLDGNLIFEGASGQQQIVGVDWQRERALQSRLVLREGDLQSFLRDPKGLILNEKVAKQLNVRVAETVLVQLRTVTGQQNVGEFHLSATSVDTGLLSAVLAYAHQAHVNQLLDIGPQAYISLGIYLQSGANVELEAQRLYRALQKDVQVFPRSPSQAAAGPEALREQRRQMLESTWQGTKYRLTTINDFLGPVNRVASVLNTIGLVVVIILLVIIMVGVTNTFRMVMYERTREIGTMRALGMQRGNVRGLFLLEALFLSLGGVLVGLAAAAIVAVAVSLPNWGTDTGFFIFLRQGHLSFKVMPAQMIGNVVLVAGLTVLAALFPASRAARMEPAAALHKTY